MFYSLEMLHESKEPNPSRSNESYRERYDQETRCSSKCLRKLTLSDSASILHFQTFKTKSDQLQMESQVFSNDGLRLDAMSSLLERKMIEGECLELSQTSLEFCAEAMKPFYDHFQNSAKFSREECDLRLYILQNCMTVKLLYVS
jgi:hypothetical protein